MALYSLLCESVIPDNADTMTSLAETQWYLGLLFCVFLFMAGLTLLNMLIGVMCDVMTTGSIDRKEQMELEELQRDLDNILRNAFKDYHGNVTQLQFEKIMEQMEA